MRLTKKQMEIDKMKWEKSEELGRDACGTFDFCEKCDKTLNNPCDKAYKAFNDTKKAVKTAKAAKDAKPEARTAKAAKGAKDARAAEVAATKAE